MSRINDIQQKIMQLEGGAFQKLFDAYLYKKYGYENIQPLGVQTGTNKPTKGTPDSYIKTKEKKYILVHYGSVEKGSFSKMRQDILSSFDTAKLKISEHEISKIICGHTSTNLHLEQTKELESLINGVEIELIGIGTVSHDLYFYYTGLAKDFLGIAIDTHQVFDINEFIFTCDRNQMNAPIGCDFRCREKELEEIDSYISNNQSTVIIGASGIGKTRIALEVCKQFDEQGWKVLCIKSNSNPLYDDIRCHIELPGRYLFFFDDANLITGLEGVTEYINSLSESYEIRMLFTVRDYAKERVINTLAQYTKPAIYTLKGFSKEEIKSILKENLSINNELFLTKISSIARGNIRLAMLAGLKSVDAGLDAIRNSEDIFRNYYGKILDNTSLTKEDIILLALIELSGPVRADLNRMFNELTARYIPDIDYSDAYSKLSDLELVDWFKNEIVKISDQSFGNFIIYYVFYEEKLIGLSEILTLCIPAYRDRICYAINMLLDIFYSDDLLEYIKEQVILSWNRCEPTDDMVYVELFHKLEPVRSLTILKKRVKDDVKNENIITDKEFEEKKSYCHIENRVVGVLADFKDTEYYHEAVELFFLCLGKRSDLFMDFYFAIVSELLYDKESYKCDYKKEYYFLDELWKRCKEGLNEEFSLMFLRIADKALETKFSYTEEVQDSGQVLFGTRRIAVSDGIKSIRSLIWNGLFTLRLIPRYMEIVNELLIQKHVNGLCPSDTSELVVFDFECVYPHISTNIDFVAAKIINNYKRDVEVLGLEYDPRMILGMENEKFRIYDTLTYEYFHGKSISESQLIRKKRILKEIEEYSLEECSHFFAIYGDLYNNQKSKQWQLSTGISIIFRELEKNPEQYTEWIRVFFIRGGYLNALIKKDIICYLESLLGYKATKELVENVQSGESIGWKYKVWECLSVEEVTPDIASEFYNFYQQNKEVNINPHVLLKYSPLLPGLLDEAVIRMRANSDAARFFFFGMSDDEDIESVITLFENKMDELVSIYANTLEKDIDYTGIWFKHIYKKNATIWTKYIQWFKKNSAYYTSEEEIFNYIWQECNYENDIELAFNQLTEGTLWEYDNHVAHVLFEGGDFNLIQRKKKWLLDNLQSSSKNMERCRKLVYMVGLAFPDWKLDYILEYLKLYKDINEFRILALFPFFQEWTGSEIPLINSKIEFLKELSSALSGLDYIEHKSYVESLINNLKKDKEEAELREYIENAIYA